MKQAQSRQQTSTSWPWLPLVPADWRQLALARVTLSRCDGPFGSSIKSEHYADEGIRVVRLQNIGMAAYKGKDSAFLDEAHVRDEIGYAHDVLPDDLLIAGLGDENNPLGRACVAPSDLGPTIVKADCYRFRLDVSKAEPAFVALQLSALAQAECGFIATGSTRQRLNLGLAAARRLVLPPTIEQQRKVVAWLDRETACIDALIEKKTRFIELLREKRQALITQAVTQGLDPAVPMKDSGVEWLGQVPAHWDVKPLLHLTAYGRDIMYGIVLPGPDVPDGVPIVKGGDVKAHKLRRELLNRTTFEIEEPFARARLRPDDIVYSIRGSIGDAEQVPAELLNANITQDVARISPAQHINSRWLLYVMKSQPIFSQLELRSLGATIRGINIFDLKRARVPVPPTEEQTQIAVYLDHQFQRLDSLAQTNDRSIALLKERRAALITAAVSGQIDLREAA